MKSHHNYTSLYRVLTALMFLICYGASSTVYAGMLGLKLDWIPFVQTNPSHEIVEQASQIVDEEEGLQFYDESLPKAGSFSGLRRVWVSALALSAVMIGGQFFMPEVAVAYDYTEPKTTELHPGNTTPYMGSPQTRYETTIGIGYRVTKSRAGVRGVGITAYAPRGNRVNNG